MYYNSSYVFFSFLMVCLPALCSLSCPQHPDVVVDICSILLQVYPSLLISLRHLFFFCISVVSWTVIYCVLSWTKLFSVILKPKGFFFSRLLSRFCFTLTENICCMLPLIPILLLEYLFIYSAWHAAECISSVFVKATQTWMVLTGSIWVNYCLFYCFFLFLIIIMYFCSHREVWNVQYRILQSMQAKNCGTLFSVYGICKCTGRNYLYFSNVISLIWGKQYYNYQNLTTMQMRIWLLLFSYYMAGICCQASSCQISMDLQFNYLWE